MTVLFWLCILLLVYVYVGYPVCVWLLAAVRPRPIRAPESPYEPTVTVLIAAYNEAQHIERTVRNKLEQDYPGVRFVYMTGHLDGYGSTGSTHRNNEQIRNYCLDNNKILFDFADIERYDPDGNDYLDLGAQDTCDYSGGNWAQQWCQVNSASDLCDPCDSCAHSESLNCNMKARAFWWLLARLAGWDGNY